MWVERGGNIDNPLNFLFEWQDNPYHPPSLLNADSNPLFWNISLDRVAFMLLCCNYLVRNVCTIIFLRLKNQTFLIISLVNFIYSTLHLFLKYIKIKSVKNKFCLKLPNSSRISINTTLRCRVDRLHLSHSILYQFYDEYFGRRKNRYYYSLGKKESWVLIWYEIPQGNHVNNIYVRSTHILLLTYVAIFVVLFRLWVERGFAFHLTNFD